MKHRILKHIGLTIAYLIIVLAALQLSYPINTYIQNFSFNRSTTAVSYLLVTAFMTILAMGIAPATTRLLGVTRRSNRVVTVGIITFVSLCVMAICFGPFGLNVPHTRVRGIFFSEFEFARFIFEDAVALSVLAAVIEGLIADSRLSGRVPTPLSSR